MTRRKSLSMSKDDFMKHVAINNIIITPATNSSWATFTITCHQCKKQHIVKKRCNIIKRLTEDFTQSKLFCSNKCYSLHFTTLHSSYLMHSINCTQCAKQFTKTNTAFIRYKNHFCSQSCRAIFSNKNKNTGFSRSKLEISIEKMIIDDYPNLKSISNNRKLIGYELDFYFPELKLAIEINGPVHYKPIYGESKFKRIQEIDIEKLSKCKELDIQLFIVNVSTDFDASKFLQQRLSQVKEIIDNRINSI